MEVLPRYATKEGVVAIGEIGYDDQTELEDKYFRLQLELAKEVDLPVMIHTPHRDKKKGTTRSMDVVEEHGIDPSMVVVDHNNEETVREVLDRGFWSAFTLYPKTKMGSERMVAVVQNFGSERIICDSSADWGVSDPMAVPKTAKLMEMRGIDPADVRKVTYENALEMYGKSGQFDENHWLNPEPIDQRTLYEGNSVLRGQDPKVEMRDKESIFIE